MVDQNKQQRRILKFIYISDLSFFILHFYIIHFTGTEKTIAKTDNIAGMKKGENTIVMAISETFGGWGIMAKWENSEGISMQ